MQCDDASPGREVPVLSVMMNRQAFRGEMEIETRSERADIVQLQILDLVRKRGRQRKGIKGEGRHSEKSLRNDPAEEGAFRGKMPACFLPAMLQSDRGRDLRADGD